MKRYAVLLLMVFLFACGPTDKRSYPTEMAESPSPSIEEVRMPQAEGILVASDHRNVEVDYSHASDGYIMAKTLTRDHDPLVVLIAKGDEKYRYDLNYDDRYESFPLNMGDGQYQVKVCENIEGTRYAVLFSFTFEVELTNDEAPFLIPNQIVDYSPASNAVLLSFDLTKDAKTQLERVYGIYTYIVDNIDYDYRKLSVARSSYLLPAIDETLQKKKGICFDYAGLMSAMLRVQNIPTKVVTGYVDDGYHSWVEVYIDGEGWINPRIYFANKQWKLVDPTYDASNYRYKGAYEKVFEY